VKGLRFKRRGMEEKTREELREYGQYFHEVVA
jgi:hypothetical protein